MSVERINPPELERSPYYSQATVVPAGASLVFVGGQNAVDASGQIVGNGGSSHFRWGWRGESAADEEHA